MRRVVQAGSSLVYFDRLYVPAVARRRHKDLEKRISRRSATRWPVGTDNRRETSAASPVDGRAARVGNGEKRGDGFRRRHRQCFRPVSRGPS